MTTTCAGSDVYFNNSPHDNDVGCVLERVSPADPSAYLVPPIRSDSVLKGRKSAPCAPWLCFNNQSLPDPITFDAEDNEAVPQQRKRADNQVKVKPMPLADCQP